MLHPGARLLPGVPRSWLHAEGELCPALESPAQEEHGAAGASPDKATKMIRGMGQLFYEERLFSLEKINSSVT